MFKVSGSRRLGVLGWGVAPIQNAIQTTFRDFSSTASWHIISNPPVSDGDLEL
jgi:hypothetical protein